MTTYAFGGWTFGVNLQDLLNRAKTLARISSYAHLGADSTEWNARVAEFVREAVWRFILDNPAIGKSSATISVVADTQSYNVPTAMLGALVDRVAFADSGSDADYDNRTIRVLTPAQVAQLPVTWINGEAEDDHPLACAFNDTAAQLTFYPMPSAAHTVNVTYQAKETTITSANVGSPSGVTIGELPTLAMPIVARRIAADLAEGINEERRAELLASYEVEKTQFQQDVNRTPAAGRTDNLAAEDMGPLATAGLMPDMMQDF